MAESEAKMCAHEPCQCTVPAGQNYCSDSCRDAGSKEVEIACQCDHPACPLT
jgi:predicted nucleic acid-binding Zn ribbon protein